MTLNREQKQILSALATLKTPATGKEIAQAAGLDATLVNKKIPSLKKQDLIASPIRCKYTITAQGKTELGK
jgi:predicted transcriptional regulator